MRQLYLLILVLLAVQLQPLVVLAQTVEVKKPTNGPKSGNPKTNTTVAKPAKTGNSFKTATAGFNFLVEPAPAWVVPVVPPDALTQSGVAALEYGLIDEQIQLGGKVNHFHHVERRINALAGLAHGAQIQIEFDPSYQELIFHRVEVVRGGQRVDKLDPKRVQLLQREPQLEARIYDGRITASLVLEDVRVGDRVEFAYMIRGINPVFDGKFVLLDQVGSHNGPVALHQLRVLYPQARTLQFAVPKAMQVSQGQINGQRELLLQQRQVPQRVHEAGAPASAYIGELIQISEFANWNEVARWANGLFAPASTASSESLTRQLNQWRAASPDQTAQLQMMLDFVQKEIRYFGTEIGVNSHKPAMPDKVMAQRFGDCKDKSTLLIASARSIGLDAHPVLVSTTFREHTDALLPSPLAFNHAIAQVTHNGKTWWIDPTREQQTGPIEQRQVRDYGKVLLAGESATALIALPDGMSEIAQTVEDRFHIQVMGADPVLESTITWHGSMAEVMRSWLARTSTTQAQTELAKPYLRAFPKLRIKAPFKLEEVEGKNALRVVQTFELPSFWSFNKLDVLKGMAILWSLEQQLDHPQDVSREAPLRLRLPGVYRHVAVFQFGEDLLDDDEDEKWSDGQANFRLSMQSRTDLRERRVEGELRFTGPTVAPAQWRSFVDKSKQVRPRLFITVKAHVLDKAQLATLKKALQALYKTDHWRNAGQEYRTSQVLVKHFNEILLSNRLPPELLGTALVFRGNALLTLGLYDKSLDDFSEALKISKDENPGNYLLAGKAQLFLQNEAGAREYAAKALALDPDNLSAHELNLMVAYQSGDFKAAKKILESIPVEDSTADMYVQLPLMKYLIARHNGEGTTAEVELNDRMEKTEQTSWVYPVMKMLLSKEDVAKVVGKTYMQKATPAHSGKLYFYAAEKARLEGQAENARIYYKLTTTMATSTSYERAHGKRQLARIDKEK